MYKYRAIAMIIHKSFYSNLLHKVGNASGSVRPSPGVTVLPAQSVAVGEGSSKVSGVKGSFRGDLMYRLYFKGLVSEETGTGKGKVSDVAAGFGVAICDQRDTLLFESKGQLVGRGANRQGAEIQALTIGLTEAWELGIKHVAIFCDPFPIFQYVKFPTFSFFFIVNCFC